MAVQATKMVADVTWKEKWAKKVAKTHLLLPISFLIFIINYLLFAVLKVTFRLAKE